VIDASHVHRQPGFSLRLDWGSTGATAVSAGCDVAVVVDVLSFTTTLTVAADRGTIVFPYPWRDESAVRYADERDAVLAVGRSQAIDGQVSLSSATIRAADDLPRLVLPSPNGSAISFQLAQSANSVIGVSLRNRRAAAHWLLRRRESTPDLAVAIIAAGERWSDGSLRPAVEDLWGAGALVRESIEIARQRRTILAANGVTLEYPVLRHANNLESVLTYEGTSEVHQLTVGQALTGIGVLR
jgi:2-phosphosulfolactate phosphatase